MPTFAMQTLKYWKSKTGAVAVEFALIAPLIVVLIVGAWDVGRLINTTTALTNLSRTGLQYAISKYWNPTDVENAVLSEASREGMSGVTVNAKATCTCSNGVVPSDCSATNACGGTVAPEIYSEVSATKTYTTTLPYPGLKSVTTFTRSSKVRVR